MKVYEFIDKHSGKEIPYGVFDRTANVGLVSGGIDHDTAQFAARAIRRWWHKMGDKHYARAKALMITVD